MRDRNRQTSYLYLSMLIKYLSKMTVTARVSSEESNLQESGFKYFSVPYFDKSAFFTCC